MMENRAVIDIGSYSVLLLAAADTPAGPQVLEEGYQITALGAGLETSQAIGLESVYQTLDTVTSFLDRCRELCVRKVLLLGTSAMREASNRDEVLEIFNRSTRLAVRVVSEQEEAALTRRGALSGLTAVGEAMVADIGGRSTELTWPGFATSLPLGCQRATERHLHRDPPLPDQLNRLRSEIDSHLARLPKPPAEGPLVCSGGTATTLAQLNIRLSSYQAELIHGQWIPRTRLGELLNKLVSIPLADRKKLPGMETGRAEVLPAGAIIVYRLTEHLGRDRLLVSARGLTWGAWLAGDELARARTHRY